MRPLTRRFVCGDAVLCCALLLAPSPSVPFWRAGPALATAQFGEAPAPPAERPEIEVCKKRQNDTGVADPFCGTKWGVFNTARVPEFWVVHEVEFYWDYHCRAKFPPGLPRSSTTNTAANLRENRNSRAWDQNDLTYWVSECNMLEKGCKPMQHYIGLKIADSAIPEILDPAQIYATLRCVRIFQSPDPIRMTQSIATAVWVNDTESGYEVIEHYTDIAAGFWTRRPAYEAALWRIWNAEATQHPWEVSEVLFYSDLFCQREVFGAPISFDSFGVPHSENETTGCYDFNQQCPSDPGCGCGRYVAKFAMDGERLPGYPFPLPSPRNWRAACNPFAGCAQREAWLGVDFGGSPRVVNCIRILQPTHEGWPAAGYPKYSSRLSLESWTGFVWQAEKYFVGMGHGNWSDTRPKSGMAWRLTNFDRIAGSWDVHELALYEEPNCGEVAPYAGGPGVSLGGLGGLPISSNNALRFSEQEAQCRLTKGSCPQLAFDLDPFTAWVSDCEPCEQREAWIGILLRSRPAQIRCFRLYQGADRKRRTEALELGVWNGQAWEVERFEAGLGGGTWNHRPAMSGTAWRLLGSSTTEEPWTAAGLHFYADQQCAGAPLEASPIGCGSEARYPIENAFDFDPEGLTEWVASCSPAGEGKAGCAPGSAWIGIQAARPLALQVGCLRLKQHRLRARQVSTGIMEVFDGIRWVRAEGLPPLRELGGGAWQTLPGAQGSMWRLAARPLPGGFGVGLSELELFRDPSCQGGAIRANWPNSAPISSGFPSAREIGEETGYSAHYATMGQAGLADAARAFDGDLDSFWCDLDLLKQGQAGEPWTAWVGMDMTTQVTDVQCFRLAPAPVISLQPGWAELQGWDGAVWVSQASVAIKPTLVIAGPSPSFAGWQQRPALRRTMWRIENLEPLTSWEVLEAEFYESADCTRALVGRHAIASPRSVESGVAQGGHLLPARAFDGRLSTRWASWCPSGGCGPGEAWLGLGFEGPVQVRCLRLFQGGRPERQSRRVGLSSWQGDGWQSEARYAGLGGNSWQMRPAAPDTQWRLAYLGRAQEECLELPKRPVYERSWGLTELSLYSDDACSEELLGEPIASGSWEEEDERQALQYSPHMAADKEEKTFWSAACGSGARASCEPGSEWIGLDVGRSNGGVPVEVRCVKLQQSRALQRHCCDPASKLRLERWNGSDWAPAVWRHFGEDPTETSILIDATFATLGPCPSLAEARRIDSGNPGIWEQRVRRQSETCEIPLSGAIKLLTDRLCMKHPLCAEAGFGRLQTACCPMDAATSVSRCCCDIPRWNIFEDQWELGIDRRPIEPTPVVGLEYVIIRLVTVLPWVGVIFTVLGFLLAAWPRPRRGRCAQRLWAAACGPVHAWMAGDGMLAAVVRFLIRREAGEPLWVATVKRVIVISGGFFVGGMILWIAIAWVFSEVVVWVMLLIGLITRVSKSRYDPRKPAEKKRLMLVLALPFSAESDGFKAPAVAEILSSVVTSTVLAVTTLVRAIADIVLLRFAFMNMGVVDITVSVGEIVQQVPQLPLDMEWLTSKVYELLSVVGWLFSEAFTLIFEGIPRCEGPVLTFAGMLLVSITLLLVRFLNYDYFGLLAGVKGTVLKTRPMFQKAIMVSTTLVFQASTFMFMQLVMLLFSRALSLLFGVRLDAFFKASSDWDCPYEGEFLAIVMGRIFLLVTGILAMGVTFLCANGHFLGKVRVTGDFGKKVGMDLSGLDVDRKVEGRDSRVFRKEAAFAMIPTSCGIWFDDWNVNAFLVRERAETYAEQLNYPVECKECGTCHMPYRDIMKATAMQVSLAWQLFPFIGPIIGKAAEHANNPPLYYRGSKLKCFWASPNMSRVQEERERKMGGASAAKYSAAWSIAFLKDRGIPIAQRVAGIGIYAVVLYYTYVIDKRNLRKKGLEMFTGLLTLSGLVGYLEFTAPLLVVALLVVAFSLVRKRASEAKGRAGRRFEATQDALEERPWARPSLLPVLGQVFHGVSLGGAVSFYLLQAWRETSRNTVWLASAACGVAGGVLIVGMALFFETLSRGRMCANSFFMLYSIGLAVFVGQFAGFGYAFGAKVVVTVGASILIMYCSGICFRPPVVNENGDRAPSAILPLFNSYRIIVGPFGIFAGVFAGCMPYGFLQGALGTYYGFMASSALAYLVGVVYAIGADSVGRHLPGKVAIVVGTSTSLLVGFLFHWLVGAALGSLLASIVGSVMERRMMGKVDKLSLEAPKFTKSKVMASQALTHAAPPSDLMLATYVRADTPTRSRNEAPALGEPPAPTEEAPAPAEALVPAEEQGEAPGPRQGARGKKFGLGATASSLVAPQGARKREAARAATRAAPEARSLRLRELQRERQGAEGFRKGSARLEAEERPRKGSQLQHFVTHSVEAATMGAATLGAATAAKATGF